ncbi:type IV pilus twitching motility protein PilT [Nocardioides sp. Leaf285]|uniref:type IV pilus twitching motility protein PilT n=1 Tax=Nocardioides sp. Leaf285 TaxID=1736322 RepID=UPI0007028225|nr:PilT/PilU family type 4a pilus ATPase [Nocardioides sp. Leaf285]KQP63148.1 hypothetical protein ASF47_19250 [Nocardioides sp. Leaf285]
MVPDVTANDPDEHRDPLASAPTDPLQGGFVAPPVDLSPPPGHPAASSPPLPETATTEAAPARFVPGYTRPPQPLAARQQSEHGAPQAQIASPTSAPVVVEPPTHHGPHVAVSTPVVVPPPYPSGTAADSLAGPSMTEPSSGFVTERDVHRLAADPPRMAGRPELERLLCGMVWNNASDLHLRPGQAPRYRVAGRLLPIAAEQPLSSNDIADLMREAVTERAWSEFLDRGDKDTSYAMSEEDGAAATSRFRVNLLRTFGKVGAVIRTIPSKIVTLDDLGAPQQIKQLAKEPRGLVIFAGPTGSGKSTTQAGLLDLCNETRDQSIFTLEDPVEFVHTSKRCLVTHREIGEDTESFDMGLRQVRREDPDIIQIGEMRDYATVAAAIEAANTGHLVFGTLHTNSAPETISQIINMFPAGEQEQVRTTLASSLRAVVCQTLVEAPKTQRGRVLACEIMFVNAAVRANILANDIAAINSALIDQSEGNMSRDAHLALLINQGLITKRAALSHCSSPASLEQMLGNNREGSRR